MLGRHRALHIHDVALFPDATVRWLREKNQVFDTLCHHCAKSSPSTPQAAGAILAVTLERVSRCFLRSMSLPMSHRTSTYFKAKRYGRGWRTALFLAGVHFFVDD
jgi:hypothetical protein